MAISQDILGTKGRFVGVLAVPPQKETPIISLLTGGNVDAHYR